MEFKSQALKILQWKLHSNFQFPVNFPERKNVSSHDDDICPRPEGDHISNTGSISFKLPWKYFSERKLL